MPPIHCVSVLIENTTYPSNEFRVLSSLNGHPICIFQDRLFGESSAAAGSTDKWGVCAGPHNAFVVSLDNEYLPLYLHILSHALVHSNFAPQIWFWDGFFWCPIGWITCRCRQPTSPTVNADELLKRWLTHVIPRHLIRQVRVHSSKRQKWIASWYFYKTEYTVPPLWVGICKSFRDWSWCFTNFDDASLCTEMYDSHISHNCPAQVNSRSWSLPSNDTTSCLHRLYLDPALPCWSACGS